MSKGLEALDRIIDEVEKDSRTVSFLFHNVETWDEDKELVKKELKALEIIKPLVELTKGKHHCWLWVGLNGMNITQEQYDLLKEVL